MARLLFFAAAREAAGTRVWEVEATTTGEALKRAAERFGPRFERILELCSVLVDGQKVDRLAGEGMVVSADTEIAVLPPVSGGEAEDPALPVGEAGLPEGLRMIDVGAKPETAREATAMCRLVARGDVRDRLFAGSVHKGDALGTARVAGVLAAKRVPDLIPPCHPVRLTSVEIEFAPAGADAIEVRATVRGTDRTGFEMEALTAAAVAALTLYDMGKAEDPSMRIEGLRLLSKSGGKSGEWRAE
jgi:cyclic pyranopterin monophosphate synthase